MTWNPQDWGRVKTIFDEALTRPSPERFAFIASACGTDAALQRQVETLLASHDRATGFLEQPPMIPECAPVDLTGRTVHGYRVVSRLGSGGMGEVYLGHDEKLDRPVALKLLSSDLRADPVHWHRFHQEVRAASSLNHPHILVVHDVGELDGRPLMVTEYVEGQTLRARLENGCLPASETLEIALQIASALAAAHARGLVHRDVKPENVMLRPDGYVKVLDFGLAKPVTGESPETLVTTPGVLMGTPRYMSPEQARGLPVDARSDVWSLGVVLYEMIAGCPPFGGATAADVLASVLEHEPPPLTRAQGALAACVMRALAKSPSQRFLTAREFHSALAALKTDPDARETPAPRDRGTAKRPRGAIGSVAVLPLSTPAADPEIDYLADGITESVINALSQLPKLRIMARSTVFRYKGRDVDPQTVGHELNVRAVLAGRLHRTPDGFRISAELVDAVDGSQLWGGQLQRRSADVLSLQEEAAAEIAEQLRPRLTPAERKRIVKRPTANPRAFEAYLKGRYQLAKRSMDGFTKAIALFEQAIAEDRQYALAYAGLADCWTLLSAAAYGEPSLKTMARARDAAEQAFRLDSSEAEVQAALGFVRFRIDWKWIEAEQALRRACELAPGHAPAHHRLALLLSALGRHDEALDEIQRAHELDPLSLIIGTAVGRVLHFQRRYDDAIDQIRRTLDLDPRFMQARFDLGMACAQAGRYDEAIAQFEAGFSSKDPR
ncbi:MAG: protein kinase domain-containing protein, partial [Vicinamibacterales bacterium]